MTFERRQPKRQSIERDAEKSPVQRTEFKDANGETVAHVEIVLDTTAENEHMQGILKSCHLLSPDGQQRIDVFDLLQVAAPEVHVLKDGWRDGTDPGNFRPSFRSKEHIFSAMPNTPLGLNILLHELGHTEQFTEPDSVFWKAERLDNPHPVVRTHVDEVRGAVQEMQLIRLAQQADGILHDGWMQPEQRSQLKEASASVIAEFEQLLKDDARAGELYDENSTLRRNSIRAIFPADMVDEMDAWALEGSSVDRQQYFDLAEQCGFDWNRVHITATDGFGFEDTPAIEVSAEKKEQVIRNMWKEIIRELLIWGGDMTTSQITIDGDDVYFSWQVKKTEHETKPKYRSVEYTITGDVKLPIALSEARKLQETANECSTLESEVQERSEKVKNDAAALVRQFGLQRARRVYRASSERDATRRALEWLRVLRHKGIDLTGEFAFGAEEKRDVTESKLRVGPISDGLKESSDASNGTFTMHEMLMSALESYCATTPTMKKSGLIQ